MENVIDILINIVNTLNRIEVKGFENLMNLGMSIQELNRAIQTINQNQQANNDEKPKE